VISPGVYRVQHSIKHRPDAETYIEGGLFLPHCNILGCHVHYRFVKRIAYKTRMTECSTTPDKTPPLKILRPC
jgi:hypothetical protein